jgi:hypothetical protein
MRFRNIEFRWSKGNNKYELVKWYKAQILGSTKEEYCYVVAFFDKTKEGYDMRTVGNRFFDDKDAWIVGKYALEFLNAIFYIEKQEKDEV